MVAVIVIAPLASQSNPSMQPGEVAEALRRAFWLRVGSEATTNLEWVLATLPVRSLDEQLVPVSIAMVRRGDYGITLDGERVRIAKKALQPVDGPLDAHWRTQNWPAAIEDGYVGLAEDARRVLWHVLGGGAPAGTRGFEAILSAEARRWLRMLGTPWISRREVFDGLAPIMDLASRLGVRSDALKQAAKALEEEKALQAAAATGSVGIRIVMAMCEISSDNELSRFAVQLADVQPADLEVALGYWDSSVETRLPARDMRGNWVWQWKLMDVLRDLSVLMSGVPNMSKDEFARFLRAR